MSGKVDRRLLMLLASLAASVILKYMFFSGDSAPKVVAATTSIPLAEKRLQKLREQAASLPAKEALLKQVNAELATREKGIIQADTAPQAQAHLLDTIHRIAAQNGFDARGADQFTEAKPLGDAYGVVSVTETFTCAIEQLVNFLAMLDSQPEILSTNDIHISGGNGMDKQKKIQVRLSLSGVVPRKLVPVKKGPNL
jgi:hypothetical protein